MRRVVVVMVIGAAFLAGLAGTALRPVSAANGQTGADEFELGVIERLDGHAALASLSIPEAVQYCGLQVPLERADVRDALTYELILSAGRPLMPMLWTRRAPGTLPTIEEGLAARGLPSDLKYVAIIESDLRLTVRSPAGAVGPWQMMRSTAKRHGLRIDQNLDERMDLELATEAALDYLERLYEQFGDWYLVLAAYNAGENRVSRAMKEQEEASYFDLHLPHETSRYVYRLLAAKLLFEAPEEYGLASLEPLHVPEYRTVELVVKRSRADLRDLAREHGFRYSVARRSNPKLLSKWLPRGTHRLKIPRSLDPPT